jgi:hypothetical protein
VGCPWSSKKAAIASPKPSRADVSTVSRTFSAPHLVNPETRSRVAAPTLLLTQAVA